MGLWSFVTSVASSIASGVGSIAKAVVNNIGSVISGVANWVKENILGLGEVPSYNTETATVDETRKVNELLDKCIRAYAPEAEEFDKMAINIVEAQLDEIKEKLKKLNETEIIIEDYVFNSFDNNLKAIKKVLDKIFSKSIINAFSLNNNSMLGILSMEAGTEKKEKIKGFAINTLKTSNDELIKAIKKFIEEQEKFITERFDIYIENRERIIENKIDEIEKLLDRQRENSYNIRIEEEKYNNLIEEISFLDRILGDI